MAELPKVSLETIPVNTIGHRPNNNKVSLLERIEEELPIVEEPLEVDYTSEEDIKEHIKEELELAREQLQFLEDILHLHRELYSTLSMPSISSTQKTHLIDKINYTDKSIKLNIQDINLNIHEMTYDLVNL